MKAYELNKGQLLARKFWARTHCDRCDRKVSLTKDRVMPLADGKVRCEYCAVWRRKVKAFEADVTAPEHSEVVAKPSNDVAEPVSEPTVAKYRKPA